MVRSDGKGGVDERAPSARVTIRDVAAAANVSVGTASKALNGNGKLRDETRERVRAIAEQMRFSPNEQARSLTAGRTFTVGLISTDSYGRFTLPIISGLEDTLGAAQVAIMIFDAQDDPRRAEQQMQSLRGRRVDGIVVTGRRTDRTPALHDASLPVPVIYAYVRPDDPQARCVLPDDVGGGRLAAEHLIERGRMRLAMITGPRRFVAARERGRGAREALRRADRAARLTTLFTGWDERAGRAGVAELLDDIKAARIDGLLCGNDLVARGAVDALTRARIRVPRDVAVLGYDNWSIIAEGCEPPLSSVDMNLRALGRAAGRDLLDAIGGTIPAGVELIAPTLVVRETT